MGRENKQDELLNGAVVQKDQQDSRTYLGLVGLLGFDTTRAFSQET